MTNLQALDLKSRVLHGDYDVVYQPIVGREEYKYTFYCETLFRDQKSDINVFDEIQVIDRLGLSNKLIETELYKICTNLDSYNIKNCGLNRFTINISPAIIDCCRDVPEICDIMLGYIYKYTKPDSIAFEFTEMHNIYDFAKLRDFVRIMRKYGFEFMFDDFGEGSSNYSMLFHLEDVRTLKISRESVLAYLNRAPGTRSFIDSVNHLRDEGYSVICEGIDTDTKKFLDFIDCNYVQGFMYHKPMDWVSLRDNVLEPQRVLLGGCSY